MTQTNTILEEVWKRGYSITPAQAYERYGCLALHSRAAEARDMGHNIKCKIRTGNGRRWGEYYLDQPEADGLSASTSSQPELVTVAPSASLP